MVYKVSWTMQDGQKTEVLLDEEEAYWNAYDCETFLKNKGAVTVTVFYNGVEVDSYLQRNIPFDFPGIFASIK